MLRSCPYCGMIHPKGYRCPRRPKRQRQHNKRFAAFRSSWAWQQKRQKILERDFHLCRICNAGGYGAFRVSSDAELQVHHIVPLEEREDLRLEEDNLIALCAQHHRMADDGKIPRSLLQELVHTPPRWG